MRPDMIDEEKREMNKSLKLRMLDKLGAGCSQILSQWQGWTNGLFPPLIYHPSSLDVQDPKYWMHF